MLDAALPLPLRNRTPRPANGCLSTPLTSRPDEDARKVCSAPAPLSAVAGTACQPCSMLEHDDNARKPRWLFTHCHEDKCDCADEGQCTPHPTVDSECGLKLQPTITHQERQGGQVEFSFEEEELNYFRQFLPSVGTECRLTMQPVLTPEGLGRQSGQAESSSTAAAGGCDFEEELDYFRKFLPNVLEQNAG